MSRKRSKKSLILQSHPIHHHKLVERKLTNNEEEETNFSCSICNIDFLVANSLWKCSVESDAECEEIDICNSCLKKKGKYDVRCSNKVKREENSIELN